MEDTNNTCFIIGPIGDPDTDIRKRSDHLFKHVFKPAAKECGYEAKRADHILEPGIITNQIIQHILYDPVVIADLTGGNPNVFYELAIRHFIQKAYVQIIEVGERIPFDVAGVRTIEVNHRDLDSADLAKRAIMKHIESMNCNGYKLDNPISITLDNILRQSESTEKRLADAFTAISRRTSESPFLKK